MKSVMVHGVGGGRSIDNWSFVHVCWCKMLVWLLIRWTGVRLQLSKDVIKAPKKPSSASSRVGNIRQMSGY